MAALAMISVADAVVVLTDAVGTDDPEQAARLARSRRMLGARVATATAAAGTVSKSRSDVTVMTAPNQQPQVQE